MDKARNIPDSFEVISELLSPFIFFCSLIILSGWILGIPTLKSILPHTVEIKANTAICFILTGLALWLLQEKRANNNLARRTASVLAFFIFLIGFLTFIEYILGINLGIDQLLFREPIGALLTSSPNRMAFISAINFILIGAALFFLQSKKEFFCYLSQLAAIIEVLFSIIALLGYIYQGSLLYLPIKYSTAIALNATLLFILVGICILFSRPRGGFMKTASSDGAGGTIMRTIWPVAIVLPIFLGWLKLYWEKQRIFTNEIGILFVVIANLVLVTVYIYILCRKLNLLDIERKRMHEVLYESKERYRQLFNSLIEGFCIIEMVFDASGKPIDFRFLETNPRFEEQTGLHEAQGKLVRELIPELEAYWFEIYGKIALTGEPAHFENEAKGLNRWYDVRAFRVGAQESRKVAICFDDITGRKRAEEKLRKQQRDQQIILDSVPAMVFYKDNENNLIRVNKGLAEAMGLSKEEMEGKSCFEFWPEQQAKDFWRDDREVMQSGVAKIGIIEPMMTPKGERWVQTDKIPYRNQDGEIIGIIGFAVDITEHKKAEERIAWLATFPELSPLPLCEIDSKGEITYANPAIVELLPDLRKLGLKHPWLVGSDAILENFRKRQIETYSREVKIGRGIYEQNIFYVPARQCLRIYGFDITVRKRIAEILQESVKTKSAFTSLVSHELRTPLSALKESISQVLENTLGMITEDQKKILSIAKRNVDRLARLITEVLDFQTLEAGKMAFKMQDNDINEVVKETEEMMSVIAKEKGLAFILNLDKDLPKIKFDRDKISQVLANLVNNSLKFTEKGNIIISTAQGSNVIQISVKDNGPGIKEEDKPRLFQQYEQIERKTGGTGLGLAISLEIIKAHGGRIWAESTFGQGTTMHFTLPIEENRR